MKKRLTFLSLLLLPGAFLLTGCADSKQISDTQEKESKERGAQIDDHHAGEENVMPHDDSDLEDDHHAGEENVMPNDDSASEDDHHAGEENVMPHDDSTASGDHDDTGLPPHRD